MTALASMADLEAVPVGSTITQAADSSGMVAARRFTRTALGLMPANETTAVIPLAYMQGTVDTGLLSVGSRYEVGHRWSTGGTSRVIYKIEGDRVYTILFAEHRPAWSLSNYSMSSDLGVRVTDPTLTLYDPLLVGAALENDALIVSEQAARDALAGARVAPTVTVEHGLRSALSEWAQGESPDDIDYGLAQVFDSYDIEWRGEETITVSVSISGEVDGFDFESIEGVRGRIDETLGDGMEWADGQESVVTLSFTGDFDVDIETTSGSCACDVVSDEYLAEWLEQNKSITHSFTIESRSCENC